MKKTILVVSAVVALCAMITLVPISWLNTKTEQNLWSYFFIFWTVLSIGILAVSVASQFACGSWRKLVVFYVSILVGISVGAFACGVAGIVAASAFTGALIGIFLSLLVGTLIAGIAGAPTTSTGWVIGVFAGAFASLESMVMRYSVFLIAVMAVSFIIAKIVRILRGRRYSKATPTVTA